MKAYTDIEQSRKLAEILPIESADMCYRAYREEGGIPDYQVTLCPYQLASWIGVPCWSLAALLEQLKDRIICDDGRDYILSIYKEMSKHKLSYHDSALGGWRNDIETDYYDNPIDAYYEMILKLHEQKLL